MPSADGRRRRAGHGVRVTSTACALGIALLLGGCTAGPTTPTTAPIATSTAAAPTTPQLPLDRDGLVQRFEQLATDLGVPGAAMLVRTSDGEITATHGVAERGGSWPVGLDDHIRIGSNTKTWTGTVILQLAEEGKLSLDDPVSTYRPDVPGGDDITVEQLLTMRSGLFNYTETYELNAALDADPQRAWDPEEVAAMGLALPPYFTPGSDWHYSNTNTVLLGLIAEQIDGKPLRQIFQDRLFTPLGMSETSFPAADDSTLPEPYARGYMFTDNVLTLASARLPEDLLVKAEAGTLLPNDQTFANPSWGWAAGAGISTIGDLATWVRALVGGGVLEPELQAARISSVQPIDRPHLPDPGYGWALARIGPLYGHTGELPGYNSFMGYDPVSDVTIVVWANLAPLADGRAPAVALGLDLMDAVYGLDEQGAP